MRSPRLLLVVTALLATGTSLSACGGSDSDGGDGPSARQTLSSAQESARQQAEDAFERDCTVHVEATGSVTASWDGTGTVTNASGVTTYQATDGDKQLWAYAGNGDIPTSANVTVDGATYTTSDAGTGLDIAGNGTGAKIDSDTDGIEQTGPHLVATFDCTKKKGKS